MFGVHGRHGAPESATGKARAYTTPAWNAVEVRTPLIATETERDLDAFAAAHSRPTSFPLEGTDIDRLVAGIDEIDRGTWPPLAVRDALVEVGNMLGRALRIRSDQRPPGPLFGGPLQAQAHWEQNLLVVPRRLRRRIVTTWLARRRADWLQPRSDADMVRLRALQTAVRANANVGDIRRWQELTRWNPGVHPKGRDTTRIRRDSLDWDPGIVATWQTIRDEQKTLDQARDALRAVAARPDDVGHEMELIGIIGLFDPTSACRLLERHRHGARITARLALKDLRAPKTAFVDFSEPQMRSIAMRHGWLTAHIDEPTHFERAVRAIRADGISDGALRLFAETGDPSGIVGEMDSGADSRRTRYTLKVDGNDGTVARVTALSRMVFETMSGTTLDSAASFCEALFRRWPKIIVTDGTEMRGLLQ